MDYIDIPLTADPYQILYLSVSPDGTSFFAKVELRYLPAPDQWFLSISDASTGELYVNQIPLICSLEAPNDLLYPFRHLFFGSGIGSLFCLKAVDRPASENPGKDNLKEFRLIWGDIADPEG